MVFINIAILSGKKEKKRKHSPVGRLAMSSMENQNQYVKPKSTFETSSPNQHGHQPHQRHQKPIPKEGLPTPGLATNFNHARPTNSKYNIKSLSQESTQSTRPI